MTVKAFLDALAACLTSVDGPLALDQLAIGTNVLTARAGLTSSTQPIRSPLAVTTVTSSATPTPNVSTTDVYVLSALATSAAFGAPTGTPTEGQSLLIRITDDGNYQGLTWNAVYRATTGRALPTSTVPGSVYWLLFSWNAALATWDLLDVVGTAVSYTFDRAYSHGGNNRLGLTADAPGSYDAIFLENIADPSIGSDQDAQLTVTAQGYRSGASPAAAVLAGLFARSGPFISYAELRGGGQTIKVDAVGATIPVPPAYADNAAAKAGGLTDGALYRTGDALKVVHS